MGDNFACQWQTFFSKDEGDMQSILKDPPEGAIAPLRPIAN